MKARLGLSTGQRLALTPGMRASLAVLRLPAEELREAIAREAAENPFLTVREPSGGDAYAAALDLTPARVTLFESLAAQLGAQRLAPEVREAALILVAELREDGYLDTPLPELADLHGMEEPVLETALAALQGCDPAGIGARSLPECLALQLAEAGIAPPLARAAAERLEDFAEGRWPQLSRALGQPVAVLERIAGLLRGFPSAPVAAEEAPPAARIPELLVEPGPGGVPVARLNPAALPEVVLADDLGRGSAALAPHRTRAGGFVAALRARAQTLLAIGRYLAERQAGFFGPRNAALIPETQAEAAAALGVHPSTLGRAIAGKSLAYQGVVRPLSDFFSRALPGREGAVSAFEVQRRIRAMIAAEPAGTPLADAEICRRLHAEGVDISRRCVAKYRKCMRIPSSFERRRRKVSARTRPGPAHGGDASRN